MMIGLTYSGISFIRICFEVIFAELLRFPLAI